MPIIREALSGGKGFSPRILPAYDRINPMEPRSSPSIRSYLPLSLLLMVAGWLGLAVLVLSSLPTVGPRWLFFFFAVLALTGTAMPVMAFFNRRFPSTPTPTAGIIVRQALWVGIYGATIAWLQIGRVLTPTLAILLAAGLVLVEFLLRLSEKGQWKP
jgi:hypothetical protein